MPTIRAMKNEEKKPAAFVFSGGAALGAAHIGVVKALCESYYPEFLIGTSAGAIIAAALACGLSPEEISSQLRKKSLLTIAFDFSFSGNGLIRGNKILSLLRSVFEDRHFEDLDKSISLAVCATDFSTGELVVLERGSIAEAVRASLAVPGIFEPYNLNGRPFVDGGLIANLPLAQALERYSGEKIIAVDVCSYYSKHQSPQGGAKKIGLTKALERSLRIMFHHQQSRCPEDARVSLIRPDLEKYNGLDIIYLKEIEAQGYAAAKDWLGQNS